MNPMNALLLKLLAPVTSHPLFLPIGIPVCAAAWGAQQAFKDSPAGTWQHTTEQVATGVVGLCAMLGLASKGVEKDGTPTSSTAIVDPATGAQLQRSRIK